MIIVCAYRILGPLSFEAQAWQDFSERIIFFFLLFMSGMRR